MNSTGREPSGPAPSPTSLARRTLLLATLAGAWDAHALAPMALVFPRDSGSHPDYATEWWYVTGKAQVQDKGRDNPARTFGFQVTFFRSRIEATQSMTSKFAARQLVFAHAAVTDVRGKRLLHDQRIAREGFDVASADTNHTDVQIKDWSLRQNGALYSAAVVARDFALNLKFRETQALLLQGDRGLSRKGPQEKQASYYYSKPQLAADGEIVVGNERFAVHGTAWLDHEWSQELLHPDAVGWDWIGMNFLDGSALTAFQLRDKAGKALWDGGSFRSASGQRYGFSRGEVVFSRQRSWKSGLSQANYPVEWIVRTPADFYTVKAVIDNQELDSRASTGAIYWEGLCDLFDSNGKLVGHGYLEMTGYARAMRL
jgi:predicted secreted hydrolase